MKKLLILFSTLFSLNLIGSSAINLNTNTKDFSHYINLGIKTIAYPFVSLWNSTRSTKAFFTISTIGGLLFFKHIKMRNDQLKKEADFLSQKKKEINILTGTIGKNLEKLTTQEQQTEQKVANYINKTSNLINNLEEYLKKLILEKPIFYSTNQKKLDSLYNDTEETIEFFKNSLEKLKK